MKPKRTISSAIKKTFNIFGLELSRTKESESSHKMNTWIDKRRIDTVIDIGSNEGQFVSYIKKILPKSKIVCFEPLKEAFNKLRESYGKDANITLNNFALGYKRGEMTMFKNSFSPSSSLLQMADKHVTSFPYTKNTSQETVRIETLDGIFPSLKIEKPFMVKIDVQGYEKSVIEGGIQTIKQANMILVELSYKELYLKQPLFNDVYMLLTNNGFVIGGILDQLRDPTDGEFLQCDAIFINRNNQ